MGMLTTYVSIGTIEKPTLCMCNFGKLLLKVIYYYHNVITFAESSLKMGI